MPSLCGAATLACRAMLGSLESSPGRAMLSPSGVPLVQPPLLVEPCSVAWMGSPMRREGHALCLGPRSAACVDRIHRISSVLDLSWYLHACRPFNIMRASLIPFNHQIWFQLHYKPSQSCVRMGATGERHLRMLQIYLYIHTYIYTHKCMIVSYIRTQKI